MLQSFFEPKVEKPVVEKKPPQIGPMEARVIISTMVFMAGYAYYSVVRARLVPKTIRRLKEGFYPYHWSHLTQKTIYRIQDIERVEHIIKANRNDPKYYLILGPKGIIIDTTCLF